MKEWYAVQTKPRQEAVAEQNLERQGFDTYLPRISLKRRRHDKWQQVVEPLFPRYLFIHVDPNQQSLSPVRSTLGVAALVRFGHTLRPVPDAVIDYLHRCEDPGAHQRIESAWPHKPGDEVRVLEGPFAGLTGIYQMPQAESRALLLIELLGRTNEISVNMDSLSA